MTYLGSPPASQAFAPGTDTFNGDGTTVAFTLSRNVSTVNDIQVVVNNVVQQPTAYSVATSTLTFTAAPSAGTANIYVRYLSTNLITIAPQQGSVTRQSMDIGSGGVGTGAAQMPVGTTSDRPATPLVGMYRMNTTTGNPEWYSSTTSTWVPFSSVASYSVDYLVVAGAGSGGSGLGGGGGAGGYLSSTTTAVTGTAYSAVVGAGGAQVAFGPTVGNSGSNSTLFGVTAIGGGGAGCYSAKSGLSGGSGGGCGGADAGGNTGTPGSGTSGQGNAGGVSFIVSPSGHYGGGGGGASAVGGTAGSGGGGVGGAGTNWQSLGTFYAGGGGGCGRNSQGGAGGVGGAGGGGRGAGTNGAPIAGTANTGGGGGGGDYSEAGANAVGAAGGSGIVIIRYAGAQRGTGGTVTSSGGYTYHTFTTSGTFIA